MSKPKYDDPAFLFYPNTFLADTILMNDEQKGQYIMLMIIQHINHSIETKHLLKTCNVKSFDEIDKEILNKLSKDDDGTYFINHLRITINKRQNYVISRLDNLKGKVNKQNNKTIKQFKNDKNKMTKYFDSTIVNKAFNEWLEMRIQNKKPATERAIQIAVNKLNEITGDKTDDYIVDVIEKSTLNNWLSFWPLNESNKQENKLSEKNKPDFSKYEI